MNLEALKERFSALEIPEPFRGETTLVIPRDHYLDLLKTLRDEYRFTMLVDLTAVDYLGKGLPHRFEVVVHLYSLENRERVRVKVPLSEDDPKLPSITGLWTAANWLEREVYDMFGIVFDGHPNLTRILMWEGFEGHPLRKDYPLRAEPPLPEPK